MTLRVLGDDALHRSDDGYILLLRLPWIRSLPLASLQDLTIEIDGHPHTGVLARVGDELIAPEDLARREEWWDLQGRLTIVGTAALEPRPHEVTVAFRLAIPYLAAGPDGPLVLPFRDAAPLTPTEVSAPTGPQPSVAPIAVTALPAHGDDAPPPADPVSGWSFAASAFNWTPEVVRAERSAAAIAVGVAAGITPTIEIEAGQVWPTFPTPADAQVDALREQLDAVGGVVSIVGASIDDWTPAGRRRNDAERRAFLLPQLHAAARLGAQGVRLPIGQAGRPLLESLRPTLHELDLVWFEEAQGHQTPDAEPGAFSDIADIDDPHVRVLLDLSMLMPALPVTYLQQLREAGVDPALMARLEHDWRDPATHDAVLAALRTGAVPSAVHTMFMNLIVRFGRSAASDLRDVLPLIAGVHLKFWDLDDADGRVSDPISDIGSELLSVGFSGTLCSEWGGHEWLDDDPATMTTRHLALARRALGPP